MKKIISNLLIAAIITSLVAGKSTAQNQSGIFSSASSKENSSSFSEDESAKNVNRVIDDKSGKKDIKLLRANLKAARANFKAVSDFNRNYKNASDVLWNTEANAIVVSFKVGALISRSVYDKAGSRLYTVLNYYEDELPDQIRQLVKRSYKNLNISLVQEILQNDMQVYKIQLEDDTTIKQILVFDGEITDYKSFNKSR